MCLSNVFLVYGRCNAGNWMVPIIFVSYTLVIVRIRVSLKLELYTDLLTEFSIKSDNFVVACDQFSGRVLRDWCECILLLVSGIRPRAVMQDGVILLRFQRSNRYLNVSGVYLDLHFNWDVQLEFVNYSSTRVLIRQRVQEANATVDILSICEVNVLVNRSREFFRRLHFVLSLCLTHDVNDSGFLVFVDEGHTGGYWEHDGNLVLVEHLRVMLVDSLLEFLSVLLNALG